MEIMERDCVSGQETGIILENVFIKENKEKKFRFLTIILKNGEEINPENYNWDYFELKAVKKAEGGKSVKQLVFIISPKKGDEDRKILIFWNTPGEMVKINIPFSQRKKIKKMRQISFVRLLNSNPEFWS